MARWLLQLVVHSRDLRRVVVAFAGFNLADWARWLAILVYAFQRGGAAEAGAVSLLQLLPAAVIAPFAADFGDRYSRERMLLIAYWSQAVAMGATGIALVTAMPAFVVYGFAVLAVIATSLTRPAHASLLPGLARDPAELTAANVASGWTESLGILLGPAIAGLVIDRLGPGAVFLLAAGVMAIGGGLVAGVRPIPRSIARSVDRRSPDGASPAPAGSSNIDELLGGFSALARLPGPRTVVLVLGAAALLWGAVDVLNVALALGTMDIGSIGAGILGASLGVGGIIGSWLAASLVSRPRIVTVFVAGLLVWGVPLIGIALLPIPLVAVGLLVAAGAGRSLMDIAGRTLLQRATPDEVLSRIFGIVEGIFLGAFGVGSILIAGLIGAEGVRGGLVVAGSWLPIVALVAWRALRVIDAHAVVPVGRLALVRAIPMFAPLPALTLERLARRLVPVVAPAGTWIIRQGEAGDRFYVVESGQVEFSIDDRVVRTDGAGASFGEIALLRDIPRTASVRAVTDVQMVALAREPFVEAVTGQAASRSTAEALVADRLGA
ncbi:MAG TPA: MFS transporter [Candidatus Eisenbacteria bacterium]|nr:MFS transporter [Candidatus Eisenbacteria bacterium]